MQRLFSFSKVPFLLMAVVNLILGMAAGLERMGNPLFVSTIQMQHGAVMVGGFLGSLIALEKVIPLKKHIYYFGPLTSASSLVAFAFGENRMAYILLLLASIILMLVYVNYLIRKFNVYLLLAFVGACCWGVGNGMLVFQYSYPAIFPWWMSFLLFTIVSERLELSMFLPVSDKQKWYLYIFLFVFVSGMFFPFHSSAGYLSGVALICISIWLMRYDVVHITIRKEGLMRYTAVGLLMGYVALLLTGLLILLAKLPLSYDMVVHTFFLGFVMSMIFAHGPIILPGVLGIYKKPYSLLFYVPLFVLHFSLLIRLLADASWIAYHWRLVSGWISVACIVFYFVLLLFTTFRTSSHELSD